MEIKLRHYQTKSQREIKQSWISGNRAPLLVVPTGGGKTITFCDIDKKLAAAGNVVWILVHRHNLAVQTSKTLTSLGIKHGIIGSKFTPSPFEKTQVVKVGSVVSKIGKIEPPDFIIVDEAHHATAGSWNKVLEAYPKARVLGVTATPERLDGTMLGINSGGFFDDLLIGPQMRDLVAEGFLSKPHYYTFGNISNSSIKLRTTGEFNPEEAAAFMDKPKILADTVRRYRQVCDGETAICFCCTVQHAEDVAEEFNSQGYRAVALVGKMSPAEQERVLNDLGTHKIDIVTSCEIISEGTDIPSVSAAILLRPTWSLTLYLQQVGRALRVAKDGRKKYILDMVGNIARHGHPLMVRDWQIEGKKKTKRQREQEMDNFKTKNCPECFGTFELSEIIDDLCPDCGCKIGTKQRQINIVDGEMVEVEWDELENMMREMAIKDHEEREKREKKRKHYATIYSCESFEDLVEYGKSLGYKQPWGWAKRTWPRVEAKRKEALDRKQKREHELSLFK